MRDTRRHRSHRIGQAIESLEGRLLLSATVTTTAAARAAQVAPLHRDRMPAPASNRWAWLADTYWYVPRANLPAVVYNPTTGTLVPVRDQTVFHITGYRNGYFWGVTVSQFGDGAPSSSALVGSVTPQGRVLLSFTSTSGTVTQGFGVMARPAGQWTMLNQMFTTPSSRTQIGHWAYMVQTRPGQRSWNVLPSAQVSVPTFLANYSGPAPRPVG